jgi:cytochrome c biogenesis protein
MRTALILLFLLALGAIPGSLLPQEGADAGEVAQYFTAHPDLAPWLNRLGLFNVFAAPWFAAIYILLFASLVGCVVPRTFKLAGSARTPPPRAPRNLKRLPHSTTYASSLPPAEAVENAAAVLAGHRYRLRRPAAADGGGSWVSAEKGYLRELGNLLFHLSLLGVLLSIAAGGLFGYKADKLLVEGQSFANTAAALDEFHPGRLVTGSDLAPFSLTLDKFTATYIETGTERGQPSDFNAKVSYTSTPGGATKSYNIRINDPLAVDGVKVYLIGHGYAPEFEVTAANGKTYEETNPFIPSNSSSLVSDGVIKAPEANLGFEGVFVPTAISVNGSVESIFPEADNPVVSMNAYSGNLGLNNGQSQSVYTLDTTGLTELSGSPKVLAAGQTWTLPDGKGSVRFLGVKSWVSLQTTYDPGQIPALVCGMLSLAGLLISFFVRRRRMFVRAVPAASGAGSLVTVGGLTRSDASGGFEDEFAELTAEIYAAGPPGGAEPPADEPLAVEPEQPEPGRDTEPGSSQSESGV